MKKLQGVIPKHVNLSSKWTAQQSHGSRTKMKLQILIKLQFLTVRSSLNFDCITLNYNTKARMNRLQKLRDAYPLYV